LVVGDQAFFFEPGQPRVDRAWRRSVDTHEPVAKQPDDVVAVPWLLVEQAQQGQPEPSMTEYRAHRGSLSISASARGAWARGVVRRRGRRNSVTAPETLFTDTFPDPPPRLPLTVCDPGDMVVRRVSNSLLTFPDVECSRTLASLSAGSLRVTSPEIV